MTSAACLACALACCAIRDSVSQFLATSLIDVLISSVAVATELAELDISSAAAAIMVTFVESCSPAAATVVACAFISSAPDAICVDTADSSSEEVDSVRLFCSRLFDHPL